MLIMFLSFKDLVIYTHFFINKDFIVKYLCINRDKPALQCNGKCYLAKSIEKSHREAEKVPDFLTENTTSIVFIMTDNIIISVNQKPLIYSAACPANVWFNTNETITSSAYRQEIFHPPCILS